VNPSNTLRQTFGKLTNKPRALPATRRRLWRNATVAIGAAANAGLLALAILATSRPELRAQLTAYRREIADAVRRDRLS